MNGIWCVGIIITKCFISDAVPIEDFCVLYEQVIVAKGDGAIVAPVGVKRRLLANELKFKRFCNGSSKGN